MTWSFSHWNILIWLIGHWLDFNPISNPIFHFSIPTFILSNMSAAPTTPESHGNYHCGISKADREKIWNADPNDGCCLIQDFVDGVVHCHCIPRRHMQDEDLVCETTSIYSVYWNIYCSSISLSGHGTWNLALWIWTCVTASFVVGTPIGSVISHLRILPSIATATLHHLFDRKKWLLIPEDFVIQEYYKSLRTVVKCHYVCRGCFPQFSVCFLIMT